MEDNLSYDLVVIGTGFHGLSVAKTYLHLNPSAPIALFDTGPTPGGVWSSDRLYPGLKTNNRFGKYEFGDFPMQGEGLTDFHHIPAKTVYRYLCSYAEKFDLVRRTHFNTKVEIVEQVGREGWLLTVRSTTNSVHPVRQILAARLVVAAGLTSTPFMPAIRGAENFNAPLFHAKEYATRDGALRNARQVTVLGGGKSGWDVAYAYASAGVQVDWVIRKHGHGPCWMTPRNVMGPFKVVSEKLISTRVVTWLSPCIYGHADGYIQVRKFLNQTWIGRKMIDGFAFMMNHGAIHENGYNNHPETKKLKPWCGVFWIGSNRGRMNYDTDILQLVRDGKIRVHIEDVTHLSDRTVHLSNGSQLQSDAFICCTGWKHSLPIKFLRDGQDISAELGLPHALPKVPNPLLHRADVEILSRFPRLRDQPKLNHDIQSLESRTPTPERSGEFTEPYRLYRFMVPPKHIHNRTIAFAGVVRNGSTAWLAQVQALWIAAFFAGQIVHLNRTGKDFDGEIEYETVLHSRFGRWRYPAGFGRFFPDFFFDALPYVDLMLGELGLKFRRKGSFWKEIFEAYGPPDYAHITEEWFEKQRKQKEKVQKSLVQQKLETTDAASREGKHKPGIPEMMSSSLAGQSFTALLARIAGLMLLFSIVTSGVLAARQD